MNKMQCFRKTPHQEHVWAFFYDPAPTDALCMGIPLVKPDQKQPSGVVVDLNDKFKRLLLGAPHAEDCISLHSGRDCNCWKGEALQCLDLIVVD